mmetsp:Transcript_3529/g.10847  ORF Transcript_3529/g.10847 Transcript_3529/m.10847 type:complete len:285 (+) Transcript_3529:183-1037(+)
MAPAGVRGRAADVPRLAGAPREGDPGDSVPARTAGQFRAVRAEPACEELDGKRFSSGRRGSGASRAPQATTPYATRDGAPGVDAEAARDLRADHSEIRLSRRASTLDSIATDDGAMGVALGPRRPRTVDRVRHARLRARQLTVVPHGPRRDARGVGNLARGPRRLRPERRRERQQRVAHRDRGPRRPKARRGLEAGPDAPVRERQVRPRQVQASRGRVLRVCLRPLPSQDVVAVHHSRRLARGAARLEGRLRRHARRGAPLGRRLSDARVDDRRGYGAGVSARA